MAQLYNPVFFRSLRNEVEARFQARCELPQLTPSEQTLYKAEMERVLRVIDTNELLRHQVELSAQSQLMKYVLFA